MPPSNVLQTHRDASHHKILTLQTNSSWIDSALWWLHLRALVPILDMPLSALQIVYNVK